MKALLKKNFLLIIKSFSWIWLLAGIILFIWLGRIFTIMPIIFAGIYLLFLYIAICHRDEDLKSGYVIQEAISPYTFKDRVISEYVTVFIFCFLYTFVSLYASVWMYRLFRLLPLLSLIPAACLLPWYYLNPNRRANIIVNIAAWIITYTMFTELENMPLVVQTLPVWCIISINAGCLLLYTFSASLAVLFIKKKESTI